jgi:protein-S-isoprenylcysteine O-methyltransferase Ste14
VIRTLLTLRALTAVLWAGAVIFFAETRSSWPWLGVAAVVAGEALRLWASGYGVAWNRVDSAEALAHLSAAGPYRWVRNPKAVGNVAVAVGLSLWSGGLLPWLPLATAFVFILLEWLVQSARDRELGRRFRWEYRAYRGTVPIWLPRFTRRPPAIRSRWRLSVALAGEAVVLIQIVAVAAAAYIRPRALNRLR